MSRVHQVREDVTRSDVSFTLQHYIILVPPSRLYFPLCTFTFLLYNLYTSTCHLKGDNPYTGAPIISCWQFKQFSNLCKLDFFISSCVRITLSRLTFLYTCTWYIKDTIFVYFYIYNIFLYNLVFFQDIGRWNFYQWSASKIINISIIKKTSAFIHEISALIHETSFLGVPVHGYFLLIAYIPMSQKIMQLTRKRWKYFSFFCFSNCVFYCKIITFETGRTKLMSKRERTTSILL